MMMKIKKLAIFFGLIAVVLCLVFCLVVWNKKTKLSVLFVDIQEPVKSAFTTQLSQISKRKPVFNVFKGDIASLKNASKKADLIFAYNGQAASEISEFAKEIPGYILQTVPENFLNDKKNACPILLDHYGVFYYEKARRDAHIQYATSFTEFQSYLEDVKPYVEIPLFVPGGSDSRLLAFVGAVTEGVFGSDAYANFVNALKNYKGIDDLLKTKISSDKTVKDAFDIILDFERNGYLHSTWLGVMPHELKNYTLDSRFAIAFVSLSDYRMLDAVLGQEFSMDRMQVLDTKVKHGIIAPVIQVFCTSEKKIALDAVAALSEIEVLNDISDATKLALASAFAPSYDKQSDDVRFLAASCYSGPISDPLIAAFELDEKRGKSFCTDLRTYLKKIK